MPSPSTPSTCPQFACMSGHVCMLSGVCSASVCHACSGSRLIAECCHCCEHRNKTNVLHHHEQALPWLSVQVHIAWSLTHSQPPMMVDGECPKPDLQNDSELPHRTLYDTLANVASLKSNSVRSLLTSACKACCSVSCLPASGIMQVHMASAYNHQLFSQLHSYWSLGCQCT